MRSIIGIQKRHPQHLLWLTAHVLIIIASAHFVCFVFFFLDNAQTSSVYDATDSFIMYVHVCTYVCINTYTNGMFVRASGKCSGYSGPPRGLSALCVAASCQGHSKLGSPCSLASLVYTDFSAHSSQNQHPRENSASHQKDTRLQLVKESSQEDALLKSLYHQLRLTLYNLLKSVAIFI